jgi:hypothetical protein
MKYLRLLAGGLVALGSLNMALAAEPYAGVHVENYSAPYHGGYAAGCQNCGPATYSYGVGWGVPGCCERPLSGADHIWDGYCDEKALAGCTHCGPCTSCLGFSLFSRCHHGKSCTSCASGTSCTAGAGHSYTNSAANLHDAPPPPPAAATRQKPAAPKTSRARTRGAI